MTTTTRQLESATWSARWQSLVRTTSQLNSGSDETLRALRQHTETIGAQPILVGGIAVVRHGYARTTDDRDLLVGFRDVAALADRLMADDDWERLEIRQYAFRYRPTGVRVDFLVSRDLITLGLPYYFPDLEALETSDALEGFPVLGLHDLLFFKLVAGRMQDLADIMELCKRRLGEIEADRVLSRLAPEDEALRAAFLEIMDKAPRELENERRLGQQDR